ncbi:hypothetical protein TNCV_2212371 [Trichonephila clavipes]|nr:hypothetical protein TNCV_2212371 [Trichonephila clavipes]
MPFTSAGELVHSFSNSSLERVAQAEMDITRGRVLKIIVLTKHTSITARDIAMVFDLKSETEKKLGDRKGLRGHKRHYNIKIQRIVELVGADSGCLRSGSRQRYCTQIVFNAMLAPSVLQKKPSLPWVSAAVMK